MGTFSHYDKFIVKLENIKMSKIEKEILAATGEAKQKRKEDSDAYLMRLVKSMHELDDKEWNKLSDKAQEWFNDAAEATNNKEQLPSFPGGKKEDESEKIAKRGTKKDTKKDKDEEEDALEDMEVGIEVILCGKKGKVLAEGEITKLGKKKVTVLTDDDEEVSVVKSKIVSVKVIDSGTDAEGKSESSEDEEEIEVDDIEKGQNVRIVVDDEEIEGEVEKVAKKAITIDGEKYKKDEIEEAYLIESEGGEGESGEDSGESIDPEDVEDGMNVAVEMKNGDVVEGTVTKVAKKSITVDDTRCSFAKIVSVTTATEAEGDGADAEAENGNENDDAVRDIICKFPKMKLEKIAKKVDKADIEIGEDDLETVYDETHVVIEMLKNHDKLA